MATISENLQIIKDSTDAIKQAIIDKGGTINGNITTWADAINGISGGEGGMTLLGGLVNKLNGSELIVPSNAIDKDILHHYTLNLPQGYDEYYLYVSPHYDSLYHNGGVSNSVTKVIGKVVEIYYKDFVFSTICSYGGYNSFYNTSGNYDFSISTAQRFDVLYCLEKIDVTYGADIRYCQLNRKHTSPTSNLSETIGIFLVGKKNTDKEGNGELLDYDSFILNRTQYTCFKENTEITLNNLTKKKIQDITYNDKLLNWDFDNGCISTDEIFWIKKEEIANFYYKITLENNNTIELVGSNNKCHRLFNYDEQQFDYATDLVGKNVYTQQGVVKVIACERIDEPCKFYNIIAKNNINVFANDILASCRYNNIYPIHNMKFNKNNAVFDSNKLRNFQIAGLEKDYLQWYQVLRLQENNLPIEDTIQYIKERVKLRKNINDFTENKIILNNIENTEVGWLDRNGKAYGFNLYMPGQLNHIILAENICKEQGIKTDNPCRYLEQEGWVKYTTDFILNSDDKIINEIQLNKLKQFINTPNKLKVKGKIKVGNYLSPYISINEFNNLDIHSFERIKRK